MSPTIHPSLPAYFDFREEAGIDIHWKEVISVIEVQGQQGIETDELYGRSWDCHTASVPHPSTFLLEKCPGCRTERRASGYVSAQGTSDATLARAYGSHSPRRARRLLTYFEERGLLVARTDFHGKRVLAFPDLGCETAPGHPDAPDDARRDAAD